MNKRKTSENRILRILKESRGFTIAELLVVALIMVLAMSALSSVMLLALRHFYKVTQRTEARFLCSSLAEFVEDELLFSTVNPSPGDLTWSNGTHNMGSSISFYVKTDDGSYTKITDSTKNTYGRIAITGDNFKDRFFMPVNDAAYAVEAKKGYSLAVGMSLSWDASNEWYVVEIVVVDKKEETVLSDETFTVKPVR